ncbi:MAG: alanine racemase [Flavobacteriaceae bacterium]|nr:alanine racemase [Flavobacteriaceae bacterium]
MSQAQETILEIDLKALEHNYNFLKSKLKASTKFLAVVKAFGYGSDAVLIAKTLERLNVDYFAVAYTREGVALRDAGIKTPILVLHPQPINFEQIIEKCLEPSLYNARVLEAFMSIAQENKQKDYPIHIKFNTGLNRLGFWENDVDYIIDKLKDSRSVKVTSIFSHLAASEDLNEKEFTTTQIHKFKKIADRFEQKIGYQPLLHQLNTSGVLNYAELAQFDMVRCGIGLYGFGNDKNYTPQLKNVLNLKSVISQIHRVEPYESVGYNRAFKADGNLKTATIPIGHADGIHRALGNGKGFVKISGEKAAIIGNVCMDMIMVNITDIDCKEGDEVIIFDSQQTINELAHHANTISYEILTAISRRIKRVVK